MSLSELVVSPLRDSVASETASAAAPAASAMPPKTSTASSPTGSRRLCHLWHAVSHLLPRSELTWSVMSFEAPETSRNVSSTPARDSIMDMALSSPRLLHSSDAIWAFS